MRLLPLVTLLSAALLGFEISLLRILLVASWYHFAFLVISVALLGFGASGTALVIARPLLVRHRGGALFLLALGAASTMPLCASLAQSVPVEARVVPLFLWRQIGLWSLYWGLLALPFLLGAAAIGLALMVSRDRVATVYAANLAGSGVGAILAPGAMELAPPEWLPVLWGGVALCGSLATPGLAAVARLSGVALAALAIGGWLSVEPPRLRVDPYKDVELLARQGVTRRVAHAWGPLGTVEVLRGESIHDIPFLSPFGPPPPPLDSLLVDGNKAGSILRIDDESGAEVLDETLMSFPYTLSAERPSVLLLGERSGLNVWLALRQGAPAVTAVQPNADVFRVIDELGAEAGGVLRRPGVRAVVADPRHFVDTTTETFDLIQLVSLESSAVASGGVGGLGEDYTVTVEGLAACLRRLDGDGLLSACRGFQTPPRDNLKLLATLIEALGRCGVEEPASHTIIVRDFLAVATVVRKSPWTAAEIARLREVIEARGLTPVWFPGVETAELNHPDAFAEGPVYHAAAAKLFSADAEAFLDEYLFDLRPPTDDRPFFFDFSKLESIGPLRQAFGDLWMTRAEIAFLFVLAALAAIAVSGAAFTVAPLVLLRSVRQSRGKAGTAAYFTALGLAYLLLEMLVLSRLTLLIGDPVYAASATIAAFLVFSGIGSAVAQRVRGDATRTVRLVLVTLAVVGAVEMVTLPDVAGALGALPLVARFAVAAALVAPLAFLMGFPMPLGLARLDRNAAALVPWAWGVNGFASVLAPPLATALAMTWGYRLAGAVAIFTYLSACWLFAALPGRGDVVTGQEDESSRVARS